MNGSGAQGTNRFSETLVSASTNSHVYKFGEKYVYKFPVGPNELEMMKAAGDCPITPRGRLLKSKEQVGLIMDLGTAPNVPELDIEARKALMNGLITLTETLH